MISLQDWNSLGLETLVMEVPTHPESPSGQDFSSSPSCFFLWVRKVLSLGNHQEETKTGFPSMEIDFLDGNPSLESLVTTHKQELTEWIEDPSSCWVVGGVEDDVEVVQTEGKHNPLPRCHLPPRHQQSSKKKIILCQKEHQSIKGHVLKLQKI